MDYKKMSDAELVSLFRAKNDSAFAVLLHRHKSRVFTTIYMIVKDRDVANDLTQDIFCKVIDKIRGGLYQEDGRFVQWLVRMAHNLAIDYYRKQSKYPTVRETEEYDLFSTLPLSTQGMELLIEKKEMKNLLNECIKKLPSEQKQVLLMRHFAQMSFKEISEHTGVSLNTCLGRMRYALINLRKMLKPHMEHEKYYYP